MVTVTPDRLLMDEYFCREPNEQAMEAGAIFESILEKSLYEADGTIKPHFREFLRKQGRASEEIARREARKKQEIEQRKLFAQGNRVILSPRERALARAGLEVEELLSQGYIAVEDLDSLDWEDLL